MQVNVPREYLPDEYEPDIFHALPELHYPRELNAAYEMVHRHVEDGRGDETAIIFEDETITYGDLQRRVNRVANALLEMGVAPGDRVFLRFPNRPEYVVSCLATQYIGAVTVPSMKLLRAREIQYIIDDSEASVAIVYGALLEEFEQAREDHGLSTLDSVIVVGEGAVDHDHLRLDTLTADASAEVQGPETTRDDLIMLAYTSGTTGQPKGCIHTHREMLAIADGYAKYCLDPRPEDVFTSNAPIAFTYGYGLLVAFPLRFGATSCIIEEPTPKKLLDAMEGHDVSVLGSVPTAYNQMFAEHGDVLEGADFDALRCCVSAGEPLPQQTFDQVKEYLGVEPTDGIGSTELLHIFISHRYHEEVDPSATGRPVPGYECKVIDPDTHEEVDLGEPGLLLVRGPTGVTYWNKPEKQRQAIYDGWSHPGDVYIHREDGRLEYVSRSDDLIITGGNNVPGPEVEDVLLERDEVYQAAVVGSPDEERGEIVKAFVVPEDGVEVGEALTDSLQSYVKEQIAPYKYPREVEYLDELPTTETGKIQRAKLREREREVAQ